MPRSIAFYEQALEPLGITHYVDHDGINGHPDLKGFGSNTKAYFWLKSGNPSPDAIHFAFVAESPDAVDAFYKPAMEAGARDNISPRATAFATRGLSLIRFCFPRAAQTLQCPAFSAAFSQDGSTVLEVV